MFSHVVIGSNDLDKSKKFYDAILGALGHPAGFIDPKGRVFYATPTGNFGITKPLDGNPATISNGLTIGFAVTSPEQADAWHAAGLAHGGTACEDPPGVRNAGSPRAMYLAYLRDPDGHKLCAMKFMGGQ